MVSAVESALATGWQRQRQVMFVLAWEACSEVFLRVCAGAASAFLAMSGEGSDRVLPPPPKKPRNPGDTDVTSSRASEAGSVGSAPSLFSQRQRRSGPRCPFCLRPFDEHVTRRNGRAAYCNSCSKVMAQSDPVDILSKEGRTRIQERMETEDKAAEAAEGAEGVGESRKNHLTRVDKYEKGFTGRGKKRSFEDLDEIGDGGFQPKLEDTVSKTSSHFLQGRKQMGIFWPMAAYRANPKFADFAPIKKGKEFVFNGEKGVLLPSKFGMEDGCSIVEGVCQDGVTRQADVYKADELATAEEKERIWKGVQQVGKVKTQSAGKVSKDEDAPSMLKLKASSSKPTGDDEDADEGGSSSTLRMMWGGLLSGDAVDDEASDGNNADDEEPKGKRRKRASSSQPSAAKPKRDPKPSPTKEPKAGGKSDLKRFKEMLASDRVLHEADFLLQKVNNENAIFTLSKKNVSDMLAKVSRRTADDLTAIYLEGFEASSTDHDGMATLTRLNEMTAKLEHVELLIPQLLRVHKEEVSSWRTETPALLVTLNRLADSGVDVPRNAILQNVPLCVFFVFLQASRILRMHVYPGHVSRGRGVDLGWTPRLRTGRPWMDPRWTNPLA